MNDYHNHLFISHYEIEEIMSWILKSIVNEYFVKTLIFMSKSVVFA